MSVISTLARLRKLGAGSRDEPAQSGGNTARSVGARALDRARQALEDGDAEAAAAELETATSHLPEDPVVWLLLARAERARGWLDHARRAADRALERRGDWEDAVRLAATLAMETYRPDEALRLLDGAAPSPGVLLDRGRALRNLGRLTEAAETLGTAIDSGDDLVARAARKTLVRVEGRRALVDPRWRPSPPPSLSLVPVTGRVLMVLNHTRLQHSDGYGLRSHHVALTQRAEGFEPHLVARAGRETLPLKRTVVEGVIYHRPLLAKPPRRADQELQAAVEALDRLTGALRPAVLHAANHHANPRAATAVARARGLPVVYEVRGMWEETWLTEAEGRREDAEWYRLRRGAETRVLREVDAVVTLSGALRDDLVSRGVSGDRIHLAPNGVDADAFRPRARDGALRARYGIRHDEVVLGYVSNLRRLEGVVHLIDAIKALRSAGYPARGLVVGDGPEHDRLLEHVRAAGVEDVVALPGRVPHEEIAAHLAGMDVFVVPRVDARVCRLVPPLKPLEAMAMALPLAVSALPALDELLDGGRLGVRFAPEDAQALAAAVAPLLDDAEHRRAVGEAARAWVSTQRTWAANGPRYTRLYASLGVSPPPHSPPST